MFYIFQPFFILCSSFYLQTYTDMQSSRVTSLCYISEFLKHILALLGCFDILHLYFVEQLTNISPFAMLSSICKCDKPLEPLSTCPTYSNSFYPLQLFYLSISTKTFPFTNILHLYFC